MKSSPWKPSADDLAQLLELHRAGQSLDVIAGYLGTTFSCVRTYAKRLGLNTSEVTGERQCLHCRLKRRIERRGLCSTCSHTPGVVEQYARIAETGRKDEKPLGLGPLPKRLVLRPRCEPHDLPDGECAICEKIQRAAMTNTQQNAENKGHFQE